MKYLYYISFACLFLSCKEEQKSETSVVESAISADSIVSLIDSKWKFTTPEYSTKNHLVMTNWNEWRRLLLLLENKPAKSVHAFQSKMKEVNKQVELLEQTIPDGFGNKPILSRVNLLKTHVSQLEMYLEISSLPYKEVVALLEKIQKDLVAIVLQFEEVHAKKMIPKEEDEPVKIMVDTERRATLNAWE